MLFRFLLYLDPLSPHQLKNKIITKKNVVRVEMDPPMTRISGSVHVKMATLSAKFVLKNA